MSEETFLQSQVKLDPCEEIKKWECDICWKQFDKPQGLGGHYGTCKNKKTIQA